MTAEVALMNRIGVALAADSAVTIGRDATKIYGSAEKLFQLSNAAPVGVMIYGHAIYQGLPWETIIKAYRQALGTRTFPTIQEYANDLRRFISGNDALFPLPERRQSTMRLLSILAESIRHDLAIQFERAIEAQKELKERDLIPIIETTVRARLSAIQNAPHIAGYTEELLRQVEAEVTGHVSAIRPMIFGTLPFSPAAQADLAHCFTQVLVRTYFNSAIVSGVVVAGFGDDQYMPAVHSFEVEEAAAGLPRWRDGVSQAISSASDAAILPFAQQEPVVQFLEGIDPRLKDFVRQTSAEVITQLVDAIVDRIREIDLSQADALRSAMQSQTSHIISRLHGAWAKRVFDQVQSVVGIVAVLPKEELASMAEALVNLTKFRRRVTPERETVGGPIDVAVITKGDGFVWIRRKHYFDAGLNPRIVAALHARGVA